MSALALQLLPKNILKKELPMLIWNFQFDYNKLKGHTNGKTYNFMDT